MDAINPKLKDFIEKEPKMTLIGFGWAISWRMAIIFAVVRIILEWVLNLS